MILLCFIMLLLGITSKGDMPKIPSLTWGEKFVYFYITNTVAVLFFPNSLYKDAERRQQLQIGFSVMLGLPLIWALIKTFISLRSVGTKPEEPVKTDTKDKGPDASWSFPGDKVE